MQEQTLEMGKTYFGVRMLAPADKAIYEGALMQMTINARGRVICVLQSAPDAESMQYDSGLVFATRDAAVAHYELYHDEFADIEKQFTDACRAADDRKFKIMGAAQFKHLVQKKD